ncbi:MAG TPA: 23S rRNA (pseudouridine(1915)-N(3))-methyltransferase RlmH [Geobacteraceae bacterium]|nr:23S rRNA (pseudouridine(1915)-N(3))-methyltransferase RlmH [Geobacteraceae bacterium]
MRIRVLWVGKTQLEWIRHGINEYADRIKRYAPLELSEVREEKGAVADAMRSRECERLKKLLPKQGSVVLLDEKGDGMTSPEFASYISKCRDTGVAELAFAIGGAYGFSEGFRKEADRIISLSPMTFTHQMVRIFLLEQIYRGFTIINGEPYHH